MVRRWVLCLVIFAVTAAKMHAQTVAFDSIYRTLNFDSLLIADKEVLQKNKAAFENDLTDFLNIFADSLTQKQDTSVYDMDRSSHIEVALDIVSQNLVNGRLTGINGAGFYPAVGYYHKYGFYAGVSPGFYTDKVIAKASDVPLVALTAGYQYTIFRRWFINLAYNHTFVTYGGKIARQLLDNNMGVTTQVDVWKHFVIAGGLQFYWTSIYNQPLPVAEKYSVQIIVALRKEFFVYNIIGAKVFTITPALNFYFGDDNRAIAKQLGATEVKGDTAAKKEITKIITNNYFGFLDIEPSVMVDWRIRNVDIYLTPTLAIPFNVLNTKTDERVYNPKIYRFYLQAGVKYLFCVKLKKRHRAATPVQVVY